MTDTLGPYALGRVHHADCLDAMAAMPECCVDTILTDPPYGIGFMNRDWDTFKDAKGDLGGGHYVTKRADGSTIKAHPKGFSKASRAGTYDYSRNAEFQAWFTVWATAALRVAKPGAMLLAFGGRRTEHRLVCAIEDAGWEIRDKIAWIYGSGFPKSRRFCLEFEQRLCIRVETEPDKWEWFYLDTGEKMQRAPPFRHPLAQQWHSHGTGLKPAIEEVCVAMKPLDGTFAANAEKWGVAGLNIDGGRVPTEDALSFGSRKLGDGNIYGECEPTTEGIQNPQGRWPANLVLDPDAAGLLDEQSGERKDRPHVRGGTSPNPMSWGDGRSDSTKVMGFGDTGGASRFFYCAKASRAERNAGLEGMEERAGSIADMTTRGERHRGEKRQAATRQNFHPTVKPLALMEYLCNLTRTPTGGVVLDPFSGSGTTGKACVKTGRKFLGFDTELEYVEISNRRIGAESNGQRELML